MPGCNYQRKTKERGLMFYCLECRRVWQDRGVAGPWGKCIPDFPTIGKERKTCPSCERNEKEAA